MFCIVGESLLVNTHEKENKVLFIRLECFDVFMVSNICFLAISITYFYNLVCVWHSNKHCSNTALVNKNTLERVSIIMGKCHQMGVGNFSDTTPAYGFGVRVKVVASSTTRYSNDA